MEGDTVRTLRVRGGANIKGPFSESSITFFLTFASPNMSPCMLCVSVPADETAPGRLPSQVALK